MAVEQPASDESVTEAQRAYCRLTGFKRDLLYVIAGSDKPHGLGIKAELEAYYDKEVLHGRLYPNLDDLAAADLIKKGEKDKRTNWYQLSEWGKTVIHARRPMEGDDE